ncbi:MAG: 3-isopropylmalate dehydratase small subunit [Candidatus Binatia bacterium]
MGELVRITRVAGRPVPLRGNDIDTDRIIPARFMKAVTFDGLGKYLFYDVRFDAAGRSTGHVLDDPRYEAKGPRVAIVNKNFGCGSSREHAAQALLRWGVKGIVGESFADIFMGNCIALGMPCVCARTADVLGLLSAVEADPAHELVVDILGLTATYRDKVYPVTLPAAARTQLLEGTWDATRILLQAEAQVRQTASGLPYVSGFAR